MSLDVPAVVTRGPGGVRLVEPSRSIESEGSGPVIRKRACVICDTAFVPQRSGGRPQVTCLAPTCLAANRERTKHIRRDAAVAERRVERACEHCGRPFLPPAPHHTVCSTACAAARHKTESRERQRRILDIAPEAYRVTDDGERVTPERWRKDQKRPSGQPGPTASPSRPAAPAVKPPATAVVPSPRDAVLRELIAAAEADMDRAQAEFIAAEHVVAWLRARLVEVAG